MYVILPYTKKKAKQLNIIIKPSVRKNKKIDIYDKKNNYITSIGDMNYLDYPYYLKFFGKEIANKRKQLYKKRHSKDLNIKGTAGYYANKLLW